MGLFDSMPKRYYQQLLKERGLKYPPPVSRLENLENMEKAYQLLSSGRFPAITSSPRLFLKAMKMSRRGLSAPVEGIYDRIMSGLSFPQRTFWKAQIWSGIFPTGEYNANTVRVPKNGGYVILINEGLLDLTNCFLILLISAMVASEFDDSGHSIPGTEAAQPELTLDEAAARLPKLILQYLGFEGVEAMADTVNIQTADIYRNNLYALLAIYTHYLVQAHEFAHVFLGHLDKPEQRILSARGTDKPISVQIKSWEEEYVADFSGMVLMLESENRDIADEPWILQATIAGPFIFFRLANLIEKVSKIRYESYPPPELRERKLMDKMKEQMRESNYPKESFQLTKAMMTLIDRLSQSI